MTLDGLAIVDLDGPILDVSPRYFAAHARAVAEVGTGSVHTTLATFWAAKRRKTPPAQMITDPDRATAYAEAFRRVIEDDALLELDRVHDGAIAALARLASTRETFILSLRSNVPGARREVERLGVAAICPIHFVLHSAAGKGARARQLVDNRPVALVIGDTEADAAVARVVAAPFVAVTSGIRDDAALADEAPAAIVDGLAAAASWLEHGA